MATRNGDGDEMRRGLDKFQVEKSINGCEQVDGGQGGKCTVSVACSHSLAELGWLLWETGY